MIGPRLMLSNSEILALKGKYMESVFQSLIESGSLTKFKKANKTVLRRPRLEL